MERIEWTRDATGACGSGVTCPKVGPRPASGTVLVVGRVVTDPELLAQGGMGPDEVMVELPASLLPEV